MKQRKIKEMLKDLNNIILKYGMKINKENTKIINEA